MQVKYPGILYALFAVSFGSTVQAGSDSKLAAQLRAKDEQLLVAVHRGQRAVWEAATTEDFVYVEEGTITPRDVFLRELEEDGIDPLILRDFQLHRFGDTAIVIHTDDLPLSQQVSRAGGRYLMTETWQRRNGTWKMRIVHLDAIRTDPPSVTLDSKDLDSVTGTYVRGERRMVIRRNGNTLKAQRTGGAEREWKAEARDVFFRPDQLRVRSIFVRDSSGNVTSLIIRDENSDDVWNHVSN